MPSVELETATSSESSPKDITRALLDALGGSEPKLGMAFVPGQRDPSFHTELAAELSSALPKGTRLIYATSGAPIGPRGSTPEQVVLAGLSGDLEVGLGFVRDLSDDPAAAGTRAVEAAAQELGGPAGDLDTRRTVGIVVDDGARLKKEELLLGILDANPGLNLVGGGAGDGRLPGETSSTVLGIDGEIAADSAVVALIRTNARWATLRHHAYRPTGDTLKVTKVDDSYMQVLEIEDKPAAEAYAEKLGVGVEDLEFGKPHGFSDRPTAMRVGREYFMRAPWSPMPDGSIFFSNRILENTELELMKQVDMGEALEKFMSDEVPSKIGTPTGMLIFNCYGRYMMSQAMGIGERIDATYASAGRVAGLNAVFEVFNGFQINSTLTALAFGQDT